MNQIHALNESVGPAIPAVLMPTFKIFGPLLVQNKDSILSIPRVTESYGPHPRQKLDIYKVPQDLENSPILVFFYGGGMIRGNRIEPTIPDSLMYHNLGAFFSSRGVTTIIPDYRRVNSDLGGEDAVFPSGGEDLSMVLKWLETFDRKRRRIVFIMGNSAGGVHVSTFLFEPRFFEQRKLLIAGVQGILLKGAIILGSPFHFRVAAASRWGMLEKYYGPGDNIEDRCPYGLLSAVSKTGKTRQETEVPKTLVLLGEFDPADEIGNPTKDFVELWKKTWGEGIEFEMIAGHNHISPPPALMSGDVDGEKWGEDVVEWINKSSS